jgi:FemAB-related protein (PEP-CTERM system-associated)
LITVQLVEDENSAQWQEFIFNHPDASAYHDYAWGQAIYLAYGHKPIYFLAFQHTCVVAALPIIVIKRPFLKPSFYALPFCDVGGCLAVSDEASVDLLNYVAKHLNSTNKNPIELRESGGYLHERIDDTHTITGQKVRMLLSMPGSSEALFNSFKSKLRSQIRKAEKNGLTFELGNSSKLIDDFYQVFAHNMRALGSPVHSKLLFEKLRESYGEKLLVSIVSKDGIAIAGGIVLLGRKTASIPWASTLAEFNKLSPNMMLYWSLLKKVADSGYQTFDFGRSTFGEGTFKFKQQWGAKPVALNWSTHPTTTNHRENEVNKKTGKIRALVEMIWRKLPLFLTITIGPKIRKFISL